MKQAPRVKTSGHPSSIFCSENGTYIMPEAKKREFYKTLLKYEADHWNNMKTYLKKDLGLMAPVTSTQVSYSQPSTFDGMDFYDNHAYWLHPTIGVYWKQNTSSMVNNPDGGSLTGLAARRFAGKPYTISEYNHPYPSFYGAEGQPMLHAYAAFQGWDGVFAYSWNNRINEEPQSMEYFFSYAARTDCLAHFDACAAMFLRGDVQEASEGVTASVPLKAFEDDWVSKPSRSGNISNLIKEATGVTMANMLEHKITVDPHAEVLSRCLQPGRLSGTTKILRTACSWSRLLMSRYSAVSLRGGRLTWEME